MEEEEKQIQEALLDKTAENTELLDSANDHLESIENMTSSMVESMEKMADKPEVQKVQIMGVEVITLKGDKGETGRNPLTVGKMPPANPQKGDLWYKD